MARVKREAARECIGERLRSPIDFASVETVTLDSIEESLTARLAGNGDQNRVVSCKASLRVVHHVWMLPSSLHAY